MLIPQIYAVDSKLLNLRTGNNLCANDTSDIDRQKFCKYGWDNLFWKSSVKKKYRDENLVVRNISNRNKLAIEIYLKSERAKK